MARLLLTPEKGLRGRGRPSVLAFAFLALSVSTAPAVFSATTQVLCPVDSSVETWSNCSQTLKFSNGVAYSGEFRNGRPHGQGRFEFENGNVYEGAFRNGVPNGFGVFSYANGNRYVGQWLDEKAHGLGLFTFADGRPPLEGVWRRDEFIRSETIPANLIGRGTDAPSTANAGGQKAVVRQEPTSRQLTPLSVTSTEPDPDGYVTLSVNAQVALTALQVGGVELGARPDGRYAERRFVPIGESTIEVVSTDRHGNVQRKELLVRRVVKDFAADVRQLSPTKVAASGPKDAVAIIVGIEKYRRVPAAEFASRDASIFYDYAKRALGVPPENIRLLLDEKADAAEFLRAFKSWLPTRVNEHQTEVYVFYSGHGLPSEDGGSLYFLPHEVDRDFLERTAIAQREIVEAIDRLNPKSVTLFIDSCYSGQSRTGQALLASARPLAVKPGVSATFPANFTVISASAPDQISSSSPELRHGIFSYYLMRGMEGDADLNEDDRITLAEMQSYLSMRVSRRAMAMNRTQEPQVIGDQSRILVGK